MFSNIDLKQLRNNIIVVSLFAGFVPSMIFLSFLGYKLLKVAVKLPVYIWCLYAVVILIGVYVKDFRKRFILSVAVFATAIFLIPLLYRFWVCS
jgi:hypothetical protein